MLWGVLVAARQYFFNVYPTCPYLPVSFKIITSKSSHLENLHIFVYELLIWSSTENVWNICHWMSMMCRIERVAWLIGCLKIWSVHPFYPSVMEIMELQCTIWIVLKGDRIDGCYLCPVLFLTLFDLFICLLVYWDLFLHLLLSCLFLAKCLILPFFLSKLLNLSNQVQLFFLNIACID